MNARLLHKLILIPFFFGSAHADTINTTIIINTPGEYTLGNSIEFDPETSNVPLFSITTNDVKLNLNGHIINQKSTNTQPGIDAISVSTGLRNVAITNGNIKTFSGNGIRVLDACQGLNINNLNIISCHASGIYLDGTATGINMCRIQLCNIATCTGAGGNAAYGLRMTKVTNMGALNLSVGYSNAALVAAGYGVYMENCVECYFLVGTTYNCGGIGCSAGYAAVGCDTCTFEQVTSHNHTANDLVGTRTVAGYFLESSTNITFDLCHASQNTSLLSVGSSAFGILAQNGNNNVIRNVVAQANRAGGQAAGIKLVNESKALITDSICKKNETTATTFAHGLLLSGTANDLCQVKNNSLLNNLGIGSTGFGIKDERTNSTSSFIGNYAFSNGTNYSISYNNGVTLPVITMSLSDPIIAVQSSTSGLLSPLANISVNA
jgi:hypothetical protein